MPTVDNEAAFVIPYRIVAYAQRVLLHDLGVMGLLLSVSECVYVVRFVNIDDPCNG